MNVQTPPPPVNDPNQMPTVNPNDAPDWLSDSVWNEGGANELPLFKWMRAYVPLTSQSAESRNLNQGGRR